MLSNLYAFRFFLLLTDQVYSSSIDMNLVDLPWYIWENIMDYLPNREIFRVCHINRETRQRLLIIAKCLYIKHKMMNYMFQSKDLRYVEIMSLDEFVSLALISQRRAGFLSSEQPKQLILRQQDTGRISTKCIDIYIYIYITIDYSLYYRKFDI